MKLRFRSRPVSFFALIAASGAGFLPWVANGSDTPPAPTQEFRGAWVATVHNIDWPSRPGLPASSQQRELVAILDDAVKNRLNAIIFQVRPACDALYRSDLEPWSPFLTGKMGQPPAPAYDPLEFAVAAAHARGLELHAWFNPFRALASKTHAPSQTHVTKTNPEVVRTYGSYHWLDPGEPWVRQRALDVIIDVVRRYDIDGVHIDDYFYPYPVKSGKSRLDFPDGATFARYRDGGGELELHDWRRSNVDGFVESLYRMVKAEKPSVKVGISPFGIWRPGVPETTAADLDAFDHLFADSRKWIREGWTDYFTPQLYWRIDPPDQSFPVLLEWWHGQNPTGKHVWPGIATDRVRGADGRNAYEMLRQVGITRDLAGTHSRAAGHLHWNMKSLKSDIGGVASLLRKEAYKEVALVPRCPWLEPEPAPGSTPEVGGESAPGSAPPAPSSPSASAPRLSVSIGTGSGSDGAISVRWEQAGAGWTASYPRWWVIQLRYTSPPKGATSPWYTAKVIPATSGGHFQLPGSESFDRVAIRPVSAAGTIGPPAVAPLR